MNDLGLKIRLFRERSGMHQLDLELAMDAAPSSISRIETGKVNPTKETLRLIGEKLNLNHKELDYLIGKTSEPATDIEILAAREEVKNYFEKNVFAYLIDERWRLWGLSETFRKVLGLSKEYIDNIMGVTTVELLTNPKFNLLHLFDEEKYESMLYHNLRYYYKEVGFMKSDPYFKRVVEGMKNNPTASRVWDGIEQNENVEYSIREGRIIYFKIINNISIPFTYTYEPLLNNSRFILVDWTPENRFLKRIVALIR